MHGPQHSIIPHADAASLQRSGRLLRRAQLLRSAAKSCRPGSHEVPFSCWQAMFMAASEPHARALSIRTSLDGRPPPPDPHPPGSCGGSPSLPNGTKRKTNVMAARGFQQAPSKGPSGCRSDGGRLSTALLVDKARGATRCLVGVGRRSSLRATASTLYVALACRQ